MSDEKLEALRHPIAFDLNDPRPIWEQHHSSSAGNGDTDANLATPCHICTSEGFRGNDCDHTVLERARAAAANVECLIENLLQASVDYERAERFEAKYRRQDLEDAKKAIRDALSGALPQRSDDIGQFAAALHVYAKWLRNHRESPKTYHDPLPIVPDELDRIADSLGQLRAQPQAVSEADVIIVAGRLRALNALKDDYGEVQHEKVRKALASLSLSRPERK